MMSGHILAWYTIYIHFRGLLLPDGILPGAAGAKFTLRPSLALSNIGSVTARHSSSGRQSNFAAWYTRNVVTELSKRAPPVFG